MIKIGLIGGSGCGKTSVATMLTEFGLSHIDCDQVSREVVEPGKPCLDELAEHFGRDILNPNGSLNRKALATKAFAVPEETKALNRITHKYILNRTDELIQALVKSKGVVVDAAALAESGYLDSCDYVVAVIAPRWKRIKRIMRRDGITWRQAVCRLKAQKPDAFYCSYADYVVKNGRNYDHLKKQILKIYHAIFNMER